jgi:DNA adenine methylase
MKAKPRRETEVDVPAMADSGRAIAATPIVKWAGGKTKLLPELLARLPARWGRYYEPFAGGAALFFRLAPERAVLADANPDLMFVYHAVKTDIGGVIRRLQRHRGLHCRAHYLATRAQWNAERTSWVPARRAATFVYLNRTCFNGLWRVNRRAGEFNVPIGNHKLYSRPSC